MSYKTPMGLARGLGAAGTGTHHWWQHRVSSVALLPLTIFAIFPFARALGADHAVVLEVYSNPFNAIVAILFLAVTFHHLMQGLQVVIEDYVHHKGWRTGMLLGNQMFCGAFGLAGVFAVLKIALTA
ncbi:MAG: succinate dehydrogenase, hydrophobic membrane anchor protein [Pseudomonadota bacterium]